MLVMMMMLLLLLLTWVDDEAGEPTVHVEARG